MATSNLRNTATGTAAGLALAVSFIGAWEGLSLVAYPDKFAGGLPTVCYGETRGVKLGDKYTKAQCDAMLAKAVVQFENGLDKCMKPPVALPTKTKVAFVSWSYNVGLGAACKSTLVKMVNNGDIGGACEQITRWNKAGGKVVKGLTNRRAAERNLCLEGVIEAKIPTPQPMPVPPALAPPVILPQQKC